MPRIDNSISVVTPTYNGVTFVTDALLSVFCQTRLPAEIIVVDDCSTDGTQQLVNKIAASSPVPLRLIRLENNSGGPARPINVGVAASSGEFVAILDQDDLFAGNHLEEHISALNGDAKLSFAFSWCGDFVEREHFRQSDALRGSVITAGEPLESHVRISGINVLRLLLLHGNFISGYPAFTFRRRHWEAKGGVDESLRIASDFDMLCSLASRGDAALIPKIGYWRRFHSSNATRGRVTMYREVNRVRRRWLAKVPSQLLSPTDYDDIVRRLWTDAYILREHGHYRACFEVYSLLLGLRGWNQRAVISMGKAGMHWAFRRKIVQTAGRSGLNPV